MHFPARMLPHLDIHCKPRANAFLLAARCCRNRPGVADAGHDVTQAERGFADVAVDIGAGCFRS